MDRSSNSGIKRVVFVIYPGVTLLDVTGPIQAFSSANNTEAAQRERIYDVVVASPEGGMITTDCMVELGSVSLEQAAEIPIDTLIIAGGDGVFDAVEQDSLVEWIKQRKFDSRRVASTCMGTFLIAAAGLLDGLSATTHWRHVEELQNRFPNIQVKRDPLFIRHGNVWSSAGVTAGIDLALAMIQEDMGHEAAMQVAQTLVVFFKRPGGQSQFSDILTIQAAEAGGLFADLHAWIAGHLQSDLSVTTLAERLAMSPRNFARKYKDSIGVTPAKTVEMMRVNAAKRMLVKSHRSLAEIALNTGFIDEQRLRRAFHRHVGTSPMAYRETFGEALVE
ncbi:GlxA family transcriptional regulator [Ruegeria meonggei]|uniref:HTH-type transcriptional regulator CdhR n=1 Tax=Ruegeria meonggei TaxID=1446476 RepID=A0A1X6YXI2_9RHOB|nr:GlxA family transcriptional regulator [Ruegeria meonggei]SLN33623.1 HTH-type transcriptional regulator CdhR [Ruegeria meonggei]